MRAKEVAHSRPFPHTALLVVFVLSAAITFGQSHRYALVIGNANYEDLGTLRNPINDARDIAEALRSMNFQVDLLTNSTLTSMEDAALRLGNRLSAARDCLGLFFYAGHGVQSGGVNYLIPVDAHIATESFIKSKALPAQAVLDIMQDAHNALNIVVLDACRDNPFSWARSGTRGLTIVAAQPPGSIIVFSTSVGGIARDGSGRNGVFTAELLKHIKASGLEIAEVLKRTGAGVQEATNGEQVPAIYSQFFGNAYLAGPGTASGTVPAARPVDAPDLRAESEHYRVVSETSVTPASGLCRQMEAMFSLFNSLFQFDPRTLPTKLNVKAFSDLQRYTSYLESISAETRTDFTFVSWPDPKKSELLCYPKAETEFTSALLSSGMNQFMHGFVPNAPMWLLLGASEYFRESLYDPSTNTFSYHTSLPWLGSLKMILLGKGPDEPIPLADLLILDRDSVKAHTDVFYSESWGLVHFLLNASQDGYARIMRLAVDSLDRRADRAANSSRVRDKIFARIPEERLMQEYRKYILTMKSAADLEREGAEAYQNADFVAAEQAFSAAIQLSPERGLSYYYLGLIAYSRKEYVMAERMYLEALHTGIDTARLNYALGVNAYAAGKHEEASMYLLRAKEENPSEYGKKADDLLNRIKK